MAKAKDGWKPTMRLRTRKKPNQSYGQFRGQEVMTGVLEQLWECVEPGRRGEVEWRRVEVEWRRVPVVEHDAPMDKP